MMRSYLIYFEENEEGIKAESYGFSEVYVVKNQNIRDVSMDEDVPDLSFSSGATPQLQSSKSVTPPELHEGYGYYFSDVEDLVFGLPNPKTAVKRKADEMDDDISTSDGRPRPKFEYKKCRSGPVRNIVEYHEFDSVLKKAFNPDSFGRRKVVFMTKRAEQLEKIVSDIMPYLYVRKMQEGDYSGQQPALECHFVIYNRQDASPEELLRLESNTTQLQYLGCSYECA